MKVKSYEREGVTDPVSGLAIPPDWIEKSGDLQVIEKVRSGRWALLSDGTLLRRGLTTGTTAAAACKGAVVSLKGPVHEVDVLTPAGIRVTVPVEGALGRCTAVKIGGDHESDVTAGAVMEATAEALHAADRVEVVFPHGSPGRLGAGNDHPTTEMGERVLPGKEIVSKYGLCPNGDNNLGEVVFSGMEIVPGEGNLVAERIGPEGRIELVAGPGIGRIGSRGLCAPLGKAAISPSARGEIVKAIEEGMAETEHKAVRVTLSVRDGERIAKETMNPKVGVLGGISILGSTGFVEPWNEHLGESREAEIWDAEKVVVTTGRVGLKYSRFLFPNHIVVLLGNRLDHLHFRDGQDSILCGLPALILKWGMPEILEETGYGTVAEMVEREPDHPRIDEAIRFLRVKLPWTRIVILNRDGSILRDERP